MADERTFGDRWRVVRLLGQGGQGRVYEVEDAPPVDVSAQVLTLRQALDHAIKMGSASPHQEGTIAFVNALRPFMTPNPRPRAALKELLPIDETVNASTA